MDMAQYLAAGKFVDSGAPQVIAFTKDTTQGASDAGAAILKLYAAVRDGIVYDPYVSLSDPENFRASSVLARGRGFCIGKSALLAASARVIGVPSRVGYADVRNHLTSRRLYELVKTDTFIWHSYTELYLAGRWVKATPAFDSALCERARIEPLDFDGRADSLFQPFDPAGRRHMEYLRDRGTFADVPFDVIKAEFITAYPALMSSQGLSGDFHAEAVAEVLAEQQPGE
jgi:transglutaminase-like putative cysteine protease